ncbi:hypothetical protein G6F22_003912 [Rhizopus arrhizus]|nr:hypothetical protein G6F22_003912 [Rhizopus arrhizus]
MMNNLLNTTNIDSDEPFEILLQKYCSSSSSIPTLCPSITLLIAISYIERLHRKHRNLRGTAGCGSRMIFIAYNLAAKYIYECLKLIIYTNQKNHEKPLTPPTSPKIPDNSLINEKKQKIERMEKEFLCFLNHDLSITDPVALVEWAQSFEESASSSNTFCMDQNYTSADEGDDEMDGNEE